MREPYFEDLTDRQTEVLDLAATGKTNKEMAEVLFVSVATVRNHLADIYARLGARNRTEAVYVWNNFKNPAERVIRYCRRSNIDLTPEQAEVIRDLLR